MEDKKCRKCLEIKPQEEFPKNKATKSGFDSRCKECARISNNKFRQENTENIKVYRKDYYEKNKIQNPKNEGVKEGERRCGSCKEIKMLVDFRKKKGTKSGYGHECKACDAERTQIYYHANKEKINSSQKRKEDIKAYQKKNLKRIVKMNRERTTTRVWNNVSTRINSASERSRIEFPESKPELVGCGSPELVAYLTPLLREGMTWENYGEWVMDHIKPINSFELSQRSERLACFHYTNIQPLWWDENMDKRDSLTWTLEEYQKRKALQSEAEISIEIPELLECPF